MNRAAASSTGQGQARLGVDVGGTFTDLVALVDGEIRMAKVPSTPSDQSQGVLNALEGSGVATNCRVVFAHGTTVATNSLLERRGARTALVTTGGFRDLLEIGRQVRPDLYDLTQSPPPALVPRGLRFTVHERMGPQGEVTRLEEAEVERLVATLREAKVDAVAVCLLFAFLHPEHEQRVGEALRRGLPGVHVSLSSDVLPEVREYERFSTTAADAYLAPTLGFYLHSLADRVRQAGIPVPRVMQSSGGVTNLEDAADRAAACVLSGPAAGVVGAAYVATASGLEDLLTLDMGGTSTDVAPIVGGRVETTAGAVIAGVPIRHPVVDVHTVSAGGGSIARADEGGALGVGPRSAGADPGPACYGRGGREPTVTDANLFLGYLADGAELGGEVVLRRALAESALASGGEPLGLDPLATALGVVGLANAEMGRALRVISVERGLDPREFALVAFGGAGGMHACALAEELGIETVLLPRASGVLSALGLAISDLRRDYVRAFLGRLGDASTEGLSAAFAELERAAASDLGEPEYRRRADVRYQRQSFELTVDADRLDELDQRFHEAHLRRYGYEMKEEPIELVSLRLVATVPVTKPALGESERRGDARTALRRANFDGEWHEVDVLDRVRMGRGSTVAGPAIVEFPEATCVVRPGWAGEVDRVGTLVVERR